MAKGSRATSRKANNVRLKKNVFGPVENARMERLSAKLLELAAQPRPTRVVEDIAMDAEEEIDDSKDIDATPETKDVEAMEIDQDTTKTATASKGRVEKKRRHKSSRKASIVFLKYADKQGKSRKSKK